MIYFTAHTFNCVCHCIRAMFIVLGMYNFACIANIVPVYHQDLWGIYVRENSFFAGFMTHSPTISKHSVTYNSIIPCEFVDRENILNNSFSKITKNTNIQSMNIFSK